MKYNESHMDGILRSVFALIERSHFRDHKLLPWYCSKVEFPRELGDYIGQLFKDRFPDDYAIKKARAADEQKREWMDRKKASLETPPTLVPYSLKSAFERSCWHTGEVTRMCECGGPQIPVATDGRTEWAICPICGKSWDMETLEEISTETNNHNEN